MKHPVVYIMASDRNGKLYTGVTSNLIQRVLQHKNNLIKGFSTRYNCKMLVYFEQFEDISCAILREKQIKHYNRSKKLELIESVNPHWCDLYQQILG